MDASTDPLRILVVDDEINIRTMLAMCLEADGHNVIAHSNISDALAEITRHVFDMVFLDVRLGMDNGLDFLPTLLAESPWAKVIVITAYASIDTAVAAMKRGATDYLPKPFDPLQVQLVTRKVAERRQLERRVEVLQAALGSIDAEADFPTQSPSMLAALELARRVAASNAPVLISGEVGVGKGRVARAIHAWSPRSAGPFATVSCRLASDALEAELFGPPLASPPAGANGAEIARPGRVAFCDGGTLVLEDIDQMPPQLQLKLHRLLHDNEYEPVDQVRARPARVRIVAITTIDLNQAAAQGAFRQELLLSLNVVEVQIPALRNRAQDILLLADRYLEFFSQQNQQVVSGFTTDARFALERHSWPGNVRELRNVIERAVLLCTGDRIGIEHLPPNLLNSTPLCAVGDFVPLETIEKIHILKVVESTRSLRRAASILGIDSGTLCRRMKRYGADDEQPAA